MNIDGAHSRAGYAKHAEHPVTYTRSRRNPRGVYIANRRRYHSFDTTFQKRNLERPNQMTTEDKTAKLFTLLNQAGVNAIGMLANSEDKKGVEFANGVIAGLTRAYAIAVSVYGKPADELIPVQAMPNPSGAHDDLADAFSFALINSLHRIEDSRAAEELIAEQIATIDRRIEEINAELHATPFEKRDDDCYHELLNEVEGLAWDRYDLVTPEKV